jgi:gamma-glutamyltranspeptidase/glutathione hydrolase
MVATSQTHAVDAGVEVLKNGGNAADAAIATAAALAVTEPCSNGLGGDCFALYFDSRSSSVTAINGSGRAPAGLTFERLAARGLDGELPWLDPHTVTVPGACAGWCDLRDRLGTLPMGDILAPAIRLARNGFAVGDITAHFWQRGARVQLARGPTGAEMLIDGRAPSAGESFRNPHMAEVLETIADGGASAFYGGRIGHAIADAVQAAGGVLTTDDLAAHRSTWDKPISTLFSDVRVYECPPNGQGITALIALNILRSLGDLGAASSVERQHLVIEALRLAFADSRAYVADPRTTQVRVEELLSEEYANARAALIDPSRAMTAPPAGQPHFGDDTVYLTVVDGAGNACSFIQSNYMGFGTGIVPERCGFTLQNRGHNFSLDPDHANALAPGKRPFHTIIPALATHRDGSLYASFGVMGGFMQPQGHVQVLLGLLIDGLDPQQALDRARLCIDPVGPRHDVALEQGFATDSKALEALGHEVRTVSGYDRALFGRGQIIVREGEVLVGGSDRRGDGCAKAVEPI